MTFDFLINGQESPSGAALLGLHSLMAITFLIQAHIPSHLDADSAQDRNAPMRGRGKVAAPAI
jgi:hypothetical protein